MSEATVANEMVVSILAGCRARGLDSARLLRASGIPASSLRQRADETPWNDFIALLDKIQTEVDGPEGMSRFAESLLPGNRVMRLLGALVVDPRSLYFTGAERMARRLVRNVGGRMYPVGDGRIGYIARLPAGCRPSHSFWYLLAGILRSLPSALGLDEAAVDVTAEPLHARYVITPPPARGLARLATRLRSPLRALLPDGHEPSVGDLREAARLGLNDEAAAEIAAEIGPRLASYADGTTFGAEVAAVMKRLFCCTHVALWSYQSNGQQVLLHRERGEGGERMTRVLHLDGRPVGRIEVDVMGLDSPSNPTFDALLPWIALGLRWTRAAAATAHNAAAQADRLKSFAERWSLTERQREVLSLLIEGLANREIADALETSVKNVEIHVTNLLARAGVENRSRLISRFWQTGG